MTDAISILIQGGAVGISLGLMYILYKQNQSISRNNELLTATLQKIAEDHRMTIDRNTDAWRANTNVLAQINVRMK